MENDDILLLCHRDPDGDSLGSAMALYDSLTAMGKRVKVWSSTKNPKNLDYLVRPMPGFKEKFVVAIDIASPKMIGDGELREMHVDLCIDHHPSNPLYADYTFLVDYAATGEAVLEVIDAFGGTVSPFGATALFTALSSDTGSFKYSNTTQRTFSYAARLLALGADTNRVRIELYESKTRAQVGVESHALCNAQYFEGGRVAIILVTLEMLKKYGADESELEGLASKPIAIEGVDVGITIKERDDGSVRVSVRTSAVANACEICEAFEGGGHVRASGCRIYCTVDEAVKRLSDEAAKQLQRV